MTARHAALAGCAALALAWGWLPDFTVAQLASIALSAMVVAGLVMLTGVGGMTSFGQAAVAGIGAYATAWLCTSPAVAEAAAARHLPAAWLPWAGLLLGLLAAAAVAWSLGAVTVKLSGHYLPLGTIAWGLSLYYLFGNLEPLGGFTGLSGVPPLTVAGRTLASPRALGPLIWSLLLLSLLALGNLLDSREGRAIRALRTSRVMAESMGVDTGRARLKLFVLAGLLAALSGWLYAHLQRVVNPTPFGLGSGIELLFMAVVGGAGHLPGALLGAALITLLKARLQDLLPALLGASGNFELVAFGLLMLLTLHRFPSGLWPALARLGGRLLAAGPTALPSAAAVPPSAAAAPPPPAGAPPAAPPPAAGTVLLEARRVGKRFGGLVANEAISLTVQAAEIHALIGPNGAGKSTFFDVVSGVADPSSGEVTLRGRAMTGLPSRRFAALGLGRTFQHVRLLAERSVLENVALGAHRLGRKGWLSAMLRLDRAEEAALLRRARRQVERCGLEPWADAPAGSLPLGRQRVVEIARALAGEPAVLLLDEPAAGLRHLERRALADLLGQLRAEGLGLLVVEHDMEFVMSLADRVTVLDFGAVIATGAPAQVQADRRVLAAYLGGEVEAAPGGGP